MGAGGERPHPRQIFLDILILFELGEGGMADYAHHI